MEIIVIQNVNDLQPLNEMNTQYSRTETSEHNRRIGHGNFSNYTQPTDLIGSGNSYYSCQATQGSFGASRTSHYNGDGPSSESSTRNHNDYGNPQPVVNSFESRHGDFSRQAMQGSVQGSVVGASRARRANHSNDDDGYYLAGPSSETNTRNHHSYRNPQPVVNSFASRHCDFSRQTIQGSLDASRSNHYNNDDGYYLAGPSSEKNTRNHHSYGNPQPVVNSFGSRHHDFSRQAIQESLDATRANHYNDNVEYSVAGPSSESKTGNHHGYGNPQPVVGSCHRDFNRRQSIHERNSRVNINVSSNENYVDETITDTERTKLINRIAKLYENHVPLIYLKNIVLFDKHDWIKVSFVCCNGMKIFQAEMTCPICLGTITPQNKEKEGGRVPKWELHSVKRHVINVHLKKQKIEGKGNVGTETVEKNEDDIEKTELLEVENKPSEKKGDSLDGLGAEEVESSSSDSSDFVSYFSLAASESSDSISDSSNSDSETGIIDRRDTKKVRQPALRKSTRKPKNTIEKRNSTGTKSNQGSEKRNSTGTKSKPQGSEKRNSTGTKSKPQGSEKGNSTGTKSKPPGSEKRKSTRTKSKSQGSEKGNSTGTKSKPQGSEKRNSAGTKSKPQGSERKSSGSKRKI